MTTIPVYPETKVALQGRKGLIVCPWGRSGGDLPERKSKEACGGACTRAGIVNLHVSRRPALPDKRRPSSSGSARKWGQLDFLVISIAFSPREALHGRVIDVGRDGFLATVGAKFMTGDTIYIDGGYHVID
jgi:enoyl-[acyl-carrier protein] reductase I